MNIAHKPLLYFILGQKLEKPDTDFVSIPFKKVDTKELALQIWEDWGILFSEEQIEDAIKEIRQAHILMVSPKENIESIRDIEVWGD